jgi:hypothetical protein
MRFRNYPRIALFTILLLLLQNRSAQATTIDPLLWEQMVLDSEFIGIAECETAGGIVASYRVIESWKGISAGTRFNLRVAANYWGPQFPVTFVGERYLITAYESQDQTTRLVSMALGNPVPLWWRNIPADYHLPLWQGRVRLPLTEAKRPLDPLGSEHPDLSSFKKAVNELLSLSPEEQEVRLLQALARKYLSHSGNQDQKKIQELSSVREIVTELISIGRSRPEDARYAIGTTLSQGGGAVTLQLLKSKPAENALWENKDYQRIIADIERRLGSISVQERTPEAGEREQPPTEQQLSQMRAALTSGTNSNRFDEAFELLTRHDPGPVADYLVKWKNPQKEWWDTDYGYVIGSYFAWRCGKDREAHLSKLLHAQDPFIRVAGAVYLTFENPALGRARLEELMRLPGDPGVWAALNLARRGHKAAVPRAFEIFSVSGLRGGMSGVPHENLQLRLMTLLSNSAAASNLPQPSPPDQPGHDTGIGGWKRYQKRLHRYYAEWWQANESKIQLDDPWLELLVQQKID